MISCFVNYYTSENNKLYVKMRNLLVGDTSTILFVMGAGCDYSTQGTRQETRGVGYGRVVIEVRGHTPAVVEVDDRSEAPRGTVRGGC